MASTGGRGSTSCSIFTQFRRIIAASVVEVAMTMPGQSNSLMCLSKCTSWRHLKSIKVSQQGWLETRRTSQINNFLSTYLVTPGVAPTLHARARFKLLIKLLFPTFGKPSKQEWQKDFALDNLDLNKARIKRVAGCGAYLQHLRWWPSLCLGCGSSCRVASSSNPHQHKHWCWEALWWPVSLVRYCVSVHGTRRKEKWCDSVCNSNSNYVDLNLHLYNV